MSFSELTLGGVKGVGTIELTLDPDKNVHTFIGENGVGKTKLLESMFQMFLGSSKFLKTGERIVVKNNILVLSLVRMDGKESSFSKADKFFIDQMLTEMGDSGLKSHDSPVVYLASQSRGFINNFDNGQVQPIGTFKERRNNYIRSLLIGMQENFSNLNMNTDISQWFVTRAQSSNTFQKQEDNRVIELKTVLKLLNELDDRIDDEFLEISGDNRVSIKIDGNKRQLSQLSTGYTSILKIIQSIITGYACFTNEKYLQRVRGIVLIDEIESHLHLSWQVTIIPLLKKLFPNTHFFITTHSSIVLTQLDDGEAYRLIRDNDGIVKSLAIAAPGKAALIDILNDAFDVDLNKMKQQRMSAEQQKTTKKQLLNLLGQGATK